MSNSTLATAPAGTDYPGKMLGIVGLVLAVLFSVVGLIVSAVALSQSKKAGYKNVPALAGIIVGAISLVLGVVFAIIGIIAAAAGAAMSY
ncbi:MAG: DUF4190 domain-containing protein [Herbiconiux sp.]|uniref:DUF4190 domain-containing protein n=1 Tax=Herbiconiux sp. TaxID=1871186 RepID=UPI00122B6C35|nr:DUF4190 domain-containing protein [Herbiconiux sp.]TAJ48642.1 MAG: DUF4190 domain-containing protein [Herbiconiux sp.]